MISSLSSITSRLRFRQLSLLVSLEEYGSLHRAAEHLGMSQPGLTKALHEIEATFGMELFVRSPKGIVPNDLGRCAIRYARLIDSDLSHLRHEMQGVLRGSGGRLAVGAITGAMHEVLVGALTLLRTEQPALSIEVREGTSLELLNLLSEGRLDVALCRTSVAPQPTQFDCEILIQEKVAIAVGPSHRLAKARRVSLEQLATSHWIVYPDNMPIRKLLEREFREAGLPFPAYPTETASTFGTILFLQQDPQAVALMADKTMDFCVERGIASRLPLAIGSRHEDYGVVTRRGGTLSAAVHMLMDIVRHQADSPTSILSVPR